MWAEIEAFAPWLGVLSVVLVLALTERMRRTFATQDDLNAETANREVADQHRDERVHHLTELIQQYIGRADLMRDRMNEQDRARERETAELREEVRTGFARLESALERHSNRIREQGE